MVPNNDDDPATRPMTTEPGAAYALSGRIMLSAIVILFAVVIFMVGLHLYARWYLVRLRRRQRRGSQPRVVLYAHSVLPGTAIDCGLDPAVLNSLPVLLHAPTAEQPPSECAVCLSEFEEKEIVRLLPKCNHCFHIGCIDMWFRSHSTCPLCRSPVDKATRRAEPVEELSSSEPGSSSASGLCDACQQESGDAAPFEGLTKGADCIGVSGERRRVESVLELTQNSPASRLLSFKRILSMGRRSPAAASSSGGGLQTTRRGAGTSVGVNELDLEGGRIVEMGN